MLRGQHDTGNGHSKDLTTLLGDNVVTLSQDVQVSFFFQLTHLKNQLHLLFLVLPKRLAA